MKPTIYLIPRWSGNPHSDWYDWFYEEINKVFDCNLIRMEMPGWHAPVPETSIDYLLKHIPEINASTFFIGHSVGCMCILKFLDRYLQEKPATQIGGIFMVAGWFEVKSPWETIMPWLDNKNLNFDLLRKNIFSKKVLISTNDPFTPDYERNKILWEKQLDASVQILPGKAHFNTKADTDILFAFEELIRQSSAEKNKVKGEE